MTQTGPHNDLTDITGISVGQSHDDRAGTGVTVILPDDPAITAVDVRGGGPGTRESDVFNPGGLVNHADAIVLSGGSVYGLAAGDGVCAALGANGKGFALMDMPGVPRSPIVPTAILYDLANGADKAWGDTPPYAHLGREAYQSASRDSVLQGRAGAGYGAMAGTLIGGTGSASIVTEDGFTIAALTCVNCFGSVKIPGSEAFWSWPFEIDGEFGGLKPDPAHTFQSEDWGQAKLNPGARQNTTLAVVATDAALSPSQAKRLAVMAQDGLSRAIRPIHSPFDGDVVYAMSTGHKGLSEPAELTLSRLGSLASDCLSRAVAKAVFQANP